jgi:hypothetical protein
MTAGIAPAPRSWVVPLTVLGVSLAVLAVLNPWLIVEANTPSGGDMGAHVLAPAYLRDVLLPSGRILGWSNSWFAGFPAFYFYFPLPSLFIVALDLVLPYGVAFKIVTVLGLCGLAPAMFFFTRSIGFPRSVAAVAAAGAAPFAFMESYSIYGGNIASTLAGEFSYSWSFALGLVYLGFLIKAIQEDRRWVPWAAGAFALTALSHILTTLVLVVASLAVLVWKGAPRIALRTWVWAFALAGWWAVPLVARIGLTSDMSWTPLTRWEEVFPAELWLLLLPAAAGAVWAWRRTVKVTPLLVATLLPIVYYPLPTLLPEAFPDLFGGDRWKLWNGRLLPYWYFGVTFFAALAAGGVAAWASRRLPELIDRWWARGFAVVVGGAATGLVAGSELPGWAAILVATLFAAGVGISLLWTGPVEARATLTAVAAGVVALGGLAGVTFVDGWAAWNYSGYEGKAGWPEYQALMATVDGLPPGRIQWEANNDLDKYGTPMALMLFPYWSAGHPSMEGLFFESSLTTPFHFLNAGEMSYRPSNPIPGLDYRTFQFDRGLRHLAVFGVRYYVAFTEEAKEAADGHPELTRVAESAPFAVYELPPNDLVEVARYQPAVFDPAAATTSAPAGDFDDFALDWYGDLELLDRWAVVDGPAEWPRVAAAADLPVASLDQTGVVSDVVVEDHRVSFRTTAVGVPHLVKVSYFPNWRADGAEGPWHATPSLMVVVPTQEQVVLEFGRTWAEWAGIALTLLGLGALGVAVVRRRSGGQQAADAPQPA